MDTKNITTPAGLGRKASFLLTTLCGQGKTIFTTDEAHRVLQGSRPATYKLLHDLVRGGWLHSLGKGRYLIIPLEAGLERRYTAHEFLIARHLAPEGYIAYWTALHHHGLTEQIPGTVWVATPRRRPATTIAGVRYTFVTLGRRKFFGQQSIWIEGQPVHIADLEKSLADALDHPEHCGGSVEVGKALTTAVTERGADLERLTGYAERMRNRAIFKRLGFLVERLSLPVEDDLTERWRSALSAGYARLDLGRPAEGPLDSRWRVQVNVPDAELTGWMES
jgi:predicted transcriptional regulator of viral defense system